MLTMDPRKRLTVLLVLPACILLVPLIAMRFTGEVDWTIWDFVVAGALLFGTALLCELAIRKLKTNEPRLAVCGIILAALVLIWLELAVGIFGAVLAGTNTDTLINQVRIFAPAV